MHRWWQLKACLEMDSSMVCEIKTIKWAEWRAGIQYPLYPGFGFGTIWLAWFNADWDFGDVTVELCLIAGTGRVIDEIRTRAGSRAARTDSPASAVITRPLHVSFSPLGREMSQNRVLKLWVRKQSTWNCPFEDNEIHTNFTHTLPPTRCIVEASGGQNTRTRRTPAQQIPQKIYRLHGYVTRWPYNYY